MMEIKMEIATSKIFRAKVKWALRGEKIFNSLEVFLGALIDYSNLNKEIDIKYYKSECK